MLANKPALSHCRLAPACSRQHLKVLCIHKQYSKAGLKAKQPANALLTTPEDVVIEMLTVIRRGELSELTPYIPQQQLAPPGAAVLVAGVPVHEQGPLARCASFMDTAARRVLPGHLLRRARILSSLQLGGSSILRVSLTACTGEEVVLILKLGLVQFPGLAKGSSMQQQGHVQPQSARCSTSGSLISNGTNNSGGSSSTDDDSSSSSSTGTVAGHQASGTGAIIFGQAQAPSSSSSSSSGRAMLPSTPAAVHDGQQPQVTSFSHCGSSSSSSGTAKSNTMNSSHSGSSISTQGIDPCISSSSSISSSQSRHSTASGSTSNGGINNSNDSGDSPSTTDSSQGISISSNSSGHSMCWQLLSCSRDSSVDGDSLSPAPHPRLSPELAVLAQLRALKQQDLLTACAFNMLGRHASGAGWDTHMAAFRHLLSQPRYQLLSSHVKVELGSSGLPTQRHFLQEVLLHDSSSNNSNNGCGNTGFGRFLWRLGMQADGCWIVRSIEVLS